MDPNEAFRQYRDLMREADALYVCSLERDDPFAFDASEAVRAEAHDYLVNIEEWVARGGFAPDGWYER